MIRCPKCGSRFNPLEGQAENEWTEIVGLVPVFGNHARLVFEYVELFSVSPLRMKGKKILRLMEGLAGIWKAEKFRMNRKEYAVSRAGIVDALTVCCNKNFPSPLENHNYLKKVMMGVSEREMTGRREREDEKLRRLEGRKVRSFEDEKGISAEEFKRQRRIESLVDQVGRMKP